VASRMCDIEPCQRLTQVRRFFVRDQHYDPEKGILIATLQKKRGQTSVPQDLNFKYCPFCGTRLSSSLIEVLLEEGQQYARRIGA
jgi:hypothetical protein